MKSENVICAGFGGQGVLSLGRLIAYAGMLEGMEVSWLPSYGPEMRGGTANCHVIVSETPVGSPIISKNATSAIVMNLPSLVKFEPELVPGGKMFVNASLIDRKPSRSDVETYRIPANGIASELGNDRVANMVMLGAWSEAAGVLTIKALTAALKKVFGASNAGLLGLNLRALERGRELAAEAAKRG
jgi:2-oxoglutarate ferredoxin oxidoreductase subunit gamma